MSFQDAPPPPVPDNSRTLVQVLKLQLTKAIMDGKASEAKAYLDVIDRLSKLAWLDDLSPEARNAQRQIERAQASDKLNEYITQWLLDHPEI
jgi:hypothetical protein